jgi:hypothetical protein
MKIKNLYVFLSLFFIKNKVKKKTLIIKKEILIAQQCIYFTFFFFFLRTLIKIDVYNRMTSHILHLLLRGLPKDSYTIVNLGKCLPFFIIIIIYITFQTFITIVEKSNIKFIHLLEGKDVADGIDAFYTPSYASGNIMVDGLISNVLLSQTFYKPDIVSVIKAICGIPNPSFETECLLSHTKLDLAEAAAETYLTSIHLPPQFVNQTFSELFKSLLIHHGILCIGLLRSPDVALGNTLPFVYTNPIPSLILKKSDMVYIFAPSE